jgi:hypothetical protein
MASEFTPLEYNPFTYRNDVGPPPSGERYDGWSDVTPNEKQNYDIKGLRSQMNQQRDYSGDQFQSLFGSVNNLGANPFVSGEAYNNTPRYSPYSGTREQFTTGTQPDGSTAFNQQGYLDARFNNINNYLGKMGSFFGNMGSDEAVKQAQQANQSVIDRQAFQASLPQAPKMNFQQSTQPIYTGGGWGQQSPMTPTTPMTYRGQAPSGGLNTTNRGSHGGILGGTE